MALPIKGCGDQLLPSTPTLENDGVATLFVVGTDPDIGGMAAQVIDMTARAGDFVPSVVGLDGSFIICIEDDAPIQVQLLTGQDFTITQAQATAYLGQWYPAKILKVYKVRNAIITTGTFSVGF